MTGPRPITTLLVANRGEIACRVIRSARELGIRTVAVYSDPDATALHVELADAAVRIGPAPAQESYLRGEVILEAARAAGADAIHPGYGFLSENAAFAEACDAADIVFVGPPAEAIRIMGSKDEARRAMVAAGVPVVPGADVDEVLADAAGAAERVGFPLLVKAAAGGGGKGMRVVRAAGELEEALAAVRREARAAFGDDTVLFERWVEDARHVEVQIFGDAHGGVVHLLDRDCSTQRRHQKVMEEAPAVDYGSEEMRAAAVAAARAVDYVGAGTVEFIATRNAGEFFFLEMNTRLQVEHPVTEMITGLDLVALQLAVAAGRRLDDVLDEVKGRGHAIEFRLYAEDPASGFLPSTGTLAHLVLPEGLPGIRIDTGVRQGDVVSPFYDPMIAKIVAHGRNRAQALARMRAAIAATRIHGLRTNLDLLRALLMDPLWCEVPVSTTWLERQVERLLPAHATDPLDLVAAALALVLLRTPGVSATASPFEALPGFRLNAPAADRVRLGHDGGVTEVLVERPPNGAHVTVDGERHEVRGRLDGDRLTVEIDGVRLDFTALRDETGSAPVIVLLGERGARAFEIVDELAGALARDEQVPGSLLAPMPGQVIEVKVAAGDTVAAGDALLVLEAMKMEHTIRAPHDGQVRSVAYRSGDRVEEGSVLVELEEPG
ncbi:MAG: biotin carboxylase N-terminal domain-containing protein [Pseudomonadales bacterium]|jgi:3-methylcrotonyl-CoA carboxylase alpha subunit|nr:biotin carboxylase N-terminal domain-containing protein [Pseudomonadales bacterium]